MKKKLRNFLTNYNEYFWLIGIILIAVFLQLFTLGQTITNGITLSNTLDFSWQTDSIERFLHGYLAGRDFIFTYGPLFQLIYSTPALLFNQQSYIAILYAPLLVTVVNTIILFFLIRIATYEKKTANIVTAFLLFVIGLITYDPSSLFRILVPFFYGLLLLRFVSIKKHISLKTIVIFFLPALFGMYTFDLFILGLLTTILFIGYELYTIYQSKKQRTHLKQYFFKGLFQVAIVVLFAILVSVLLSGGLNYLIYSFDTVKNYQFIMSIPWSANTYFLLLIFPLGLCLLLLYVIRTSSFNRDIKMAFVSLTVIALLQLKSAFIRADDSHIIMGIYPSLIVLFMLFFFILREKVTTIFIILFLCFYLIIPLKNSYINTISLQNLTTSFSHLTQDKPFFSLYRLPHNYYFTQNDFIIFESYITKNPENVMIYPYDSYLLNIYGTTYNTVALQFYQYSNSVVEAKTVEELRLSPPKFIILGIDDKGAIRLDNIPNFSRNPILAKWMLQHYSVEKITENYLILRFDQKKEKKQSNSKCSIYDIDTSKIMHTNPYERLTKSPTFYLKEDTGIRLPYMPNTKEIFIIEQFNDAATLQQLFESTITFEKYREEKKQMKIIKKYPLPKVIQIYEKNFSINCFY